MYVWVEVTNFFVFDTSPAWKYNRLRSVTDDY